MSERICARPGCGKSIEQLRSDARYCDSSCRSEASRQRSGLSARIIAPRAQTFWHAYRGVTRAHKRAQLTSAELG